MTRNIKQATKTIIALLMVLVIAPATASAADSWTYEKSASFTGKGTKDDPYLIQNAQDLASLAYEVSKSALRHNEYEGMYFKQTADIVLNDDVLKNVTLDKYGRVTLYNETALANLKNWIPIGIYGSNTTFTDESPYWFKGHYDGGGHSISGIYCYRGATDNTLESGDGYDNYLGLFGAVNGGSIKNLTLKDCLFRVRDLTARSKEWRFIGAVAGKAMNEEISGCKVENTVVYFDENNDPTLTCVGGIVGYSDIDDSYGKDYVLTGCSFDGYLNVSNNNSSNVPSVGGICGAIDVSADYLAAYSCPQLVRCITNGTISYNYGTIKTAESACCAGGIVGRFIRPDSYPTAFVYVYRSTNFMNLELVAKGSTVYAGGVAGFMAQCVQSANFGKISINKTGGTVGTVYAGGIGSFAVVDNCVNYGDVKLGSDGNNASVSGQAYLAGLAVCGLGNTAASSNPSTITNSAVCSTLFYSDKSGRCHADAVCVFSNASDDKANVYYYYNIDNPVPTTYGKAVKQTDESEYKCHSALLETLNTNGKATTTSPDIWGQLNMSSTAFHRYVVPFTAGAAPSVLLDEKSDNLAKVITDNLYDGTNETHATALITMIRTLHKDKWNTVCLPFSMTSADLKTHFGNNVKLEGFSGATIDGNGVLTLEFSTAATLTAATPYLMQPAAVNTDNTYLIDNCTITRTFGSHTESAVNGGKVYMVGNYDKVMLKGADNKDQYFLQNEKFYRIVSTNPLTAGGFRCYFEVSKDISLNKARIMHNDGTTTAISITEMGTTANGGKIYDLQGIMHDKAPKGVYIKNGRKWLLK